jgi:SAM-dependent methyltransferase
MPSSPPILFDSAARRKHLARMRGSDFLRSETAEMIHESLDFITHRFPRILEIGHHPGPWKTRDGTTCCEINHEVLLTEYLVADENSLDAVIANMSLHAINDLPGLLIQIRRALKPDGLFIATLPGAESLRELRQVLGETEAERSGGITPRVAPFLEVREAGNLLTRAGFALPVVDATTLTITYPNMFALLHELRSAGEANMLVGRARHFTPRGFFVQAAERYAAQHSDGEGRIIATAEILTLTAWKPATSQQQPAKRGSGKVNLNQIF